MKTILSSLVVLTTLALMACSGGGGGGASKYTTGHSTSFSSDGSTETVTITYSDGSSSSAILNGTLTTPIYSADGSQKTLVYSFSNGTTHNGDVLIGSLTNTTYSSDGSQEFKTFSFSDHSTYTVTLQSTGSQTNWGTDHQTKTITYSFSDGSTDVYVTMVPPSTVVPALTAAVYPTDWSTGRSTGSVTPPTTSPKQDVYGDNFVKQVWEDGTSAKPFQQVSLTPNGPTGVGAINDPNANVLSPTAIRYDLTWGKPDPAGPGYVASYTNGIHTFPQNYNWFGNSLSSYCSASPCTLPLTIAQPSQDVIDAFNKGWTGKGSNVLIWDSFYASQSAHPSGEDYHGAITSLLAWRYAPGSTLYALDAFYGTSSAVFPNASIIDVTGTKQTSYAANPNSNNPNRQNSAFYMDVVNMSFGWDYQRNNQALPVQQSDATSFINYVSGSINPFTNLLNGKTATSVLGNTLTSGSAALSLSDAVITVAAGNEAIRSDWAPLPYTLANDTNLGPRTLIVGALDGTGTPGASGKPGTASIFKSYVYTDPTTNKQITQGSNVAGPDPTVQARFLVASGISPSNVTINGNTVYGISIDGTPTSSYWGTSYAAPRVAGYASVVRQKFPNLTGANTADILLATARYDTLSCYPNCDKTIYGQGEASLSRALAPVGYLR